MKKHGFKKWREEIQVKEIYPISFIYKESTNISQDDIKKFLISYLNNLEELLQNKSQIKFKEIQHEINEEQEEEEKYIKCTINFANKRARQQLLKSQYIDLKMINVNNKYNNKNIYKYQWMIDNDSILL